MTSCRPTALLSPAEVQVIEQWIRDGATVMAGVGPAQQRVRPRQWAQILIGLELNSVQRAKAQSLLTEYQRENAEFDRAHQTRIRELEQRIRETRDSNDTIANASMKQELDKLKGQRPKFEEVQETLWAMLDSDQQDAMRDALATAGARSGTRNQQSRGRQGSNRSQPSNSALTEEERTRLQELMRERRRNGQGGSTRGSGGRDDELIRIHDLDGTCSFEKASECMRSRAGQSASSLRCRRPTG